MSEDDEPRQRRNVDQQLGEPFDIAQEAPSMETATHPEQDAALRAALLRMTFEGAQDFDSRRVHFRKLDTMQDLYEASTIHDYFPKISQRTRVQWKDSKHVHASSSNDVYWRVEEFFLDLLICRGRNIGLSAALPNLNVHHGFEFKMELGWSPRTFSAKYAHLGFDPCAAMQYFGRSHSAEDVWIAWIPKEALGDLLDEEDPIAPGTCGGNTHISKTHFHGSFMFFAGLLNDMGHRDIIVWERYPDIEDHNAVENATNLG